MHFIPGRRRFLKIAGVSALLPASGHWKAAAAAPLTPNASPTAPAGSDEAPGLSTYELGPQIWVRWNNRLLTCYRAHSSQKYPYLFPLTGPLSGLSLTDETTMPYPHHRSLFFGCDRVNGGNYWQEGYETGQIISRGPKIQETTRDRVVIADTCDWQKPGGPVVLQDKRKIKITVPAPTLRMIEWEISIKAVENVIVQKTNHSFFSMRAALDITPKGGGNLVNAEGLSGEKATAGVKSAWCGFFGKRAAMPSITEGIVIFDHPKNPWAPTPWFTRDYGFASPTPLNYIEKPWTIAAEQTVNFRYAVALHSGTQTEAGIPRLYTEWIGKA